MHPRLQRGLCTRRMPKRALSWGPLSPPDASIGLTRPNVTPVLLPFDRVCQVKGQQCNDLPHPDDSPYLPGCSYPPDQLQSALEAQEWLWTVEKRTSHNELVVDLRSITRHLPDSIEGFFYQPSSDAKQRIEVIQAHAAFLKEYNLPEASAPLVEVDFGRGDEGPFQASSPERAQSTLPSDEDKEYDPHTDPDPMHW